MNEISLANALKRSLNPNPAPRDYGEALETNANLKRRIAELEAARDDKKKQLAAIVCWLEENQPDVFRRGLWDAFNAALSTTARCTESSAHGEAS